MFQKIAKHRANDASNDVHRPPLPLTSAPTLLVQQGDHWQVKGVYLRTTLTQF